MEKPQTAAKKKAPAKKKKPTPPPPASGIVAWEDDPSSTPDGHPIARPVPNLAAAPFALNITTKAPAADVYAPGSPEFRYWTAADSLRRGADFWGSTLKALGRKNISWQPGSVLPVILDAGVDLNAYYDRRALNFFHARVANKSVFSGESPDIVCHELGHAILDSIRPELWDAASDEIAAFHESFGDMSAILSQLQLPSLRQSVLLETSGSLYRTSRLSRLAEQLGWAIRQVQPDAVESDCLRNAVNSFFYRAPDTLPPSGPAAQLSSEPHSFSRVFTAGFFAALAGMLAVHSPTPKEADLAEVSIDMGKLLAGAILSAPIVSDYFSQIAARIVAEDQTQFNGKYRDALKSAFVKRGILSLQAAASLNVNAAVPRSRGIASASRMTNMEMDGVDFGLSGHKIRAAMPTEPRLGVASAALDLGSIQPPSSEKAGRSFLEDLFRRGRVDIGKMGDHNERVLHPRVMKTHALVKKDGALLVERQTFDCGFSFRW